MAFNPKSPKESSPPRQAFPAMRPRCCLRYLTFFGINIDSVPSYQLSVASSDQQPGLYWQLATDNWLLEGAGGHLRLAFLLRQNLTFVDPHLHPDYAVGSTRFAEAILDIGAKRVQRKAALQVPLGAGDFISIQTAGDANLNPLATEAQSGVDSFAHGATKAHALFKLQRNRFRDQLRVELRLVHLHDVDEDITIGALLQLALQLVNLSAFAADDDAGT